MTELVHLASRKPQWSTVTPQPSVSASPAAFSLLTATPPLPQEKFYMELHTLLIVVIFCVVCLLLLLAFFYAFCFHCSIGPSLKDPRTANRCSLDREDATYKRSSSDNHSVGNVV